MEEAAAPSPEVEELRHRINFEAERLAQRWPDERVRALEATFEEAAVAALRAPVLAERSVVLRRVAKRVVPPGARPVLRQVVARFDHLSRRAYGWAEAMRSRS